MKVLPKHSPADIELLSEPVAFKRLQQVSSVETFMQASTCRQSGKLTGTMYGHTDWVTCLLEAEKPSSQSVVEL